MSFPSNSSSSAPISNKAPLLWPLVASLIGVSFVANFFYFQRWGLYEDDYIWIMTLPPLNWTGEGVMQGVDDIWRRWVLYQCRPLGFSMNLALVYIGSFFSSLAPSYFLGFVVLAVNAGLMFFLANRVWGLRFAWVATVAFLAFPADTSKQILMGRFLHLSETFLILGLLLYQQRRYWPAYGIVLLTLISYESLYLPFLFAPFVADRLPHWRELVRHIFLFSVLAILVLFCRSFFGDQRAQLITVGIDEVGTRMFLACLIGLKSVLGAALKAPFTAFSSADFFSCLPEALCLVLLLVSLGAVLRMQPGANFGRDRSHFILPIVFAVAIAFAYVLAFRGEYFPPTTTIGRTSGVGLAAAVPFGLFLGALDRLFASATSAFRRGAWLTFLFFLSFGWVSYGLYIQRSEYTANWADQQDPFWRFILKHTPSLQQDCPILVDMDGFPKTAGFSPEGFVGTKAFDALNEFVFPPNGQTRLPGVHGFQASTELTKTDKGFILHSPYWSSGSWPLVIDGGFLLVKYENGNFTFSSEPAIIQGVRLTPKAGPDAGDLDSIRFRPAGLIVFPRD